MKTYLIALLMAMLPQSSNSVVTGKAYKFDKITDGVFYATATRW